MDWDDLDRGKVEFSHTALGIAETWAICRAVWKELIIRFKESEAHRVVWRGNEEGDKTGTSRSRMLITNSVSRIHGSSEMGQFSRESSSSAD